MMRKWGRWLLAPATIAAALAGFMVSGAPAAPPLSIRQLLNPADIANRLPSLDQLDFTKIPLAKIDKAQELRLQYAQSCKADVGFIPAFDCTKGMDVPVFLHANSRQPLTAEDPRTDCWNPAMLKDVATPCVPGTKIQRIATNNPDADVVALCRKYSKVKGVALHFESYEFNDIGIVAHNRKNGATCFFNSYTSKGKWDGRTVPSPMKLGKEGANFWVPPMPADPGKTQYFNPHYDCAMCHDADPFIVTPFLAKQIKALGVLDPNGGHDVDRHGAWSDPAKRGWVTASANASSGSGGSNCADCHRIGVNSLMTIGRYDFTYKDMINLHGFMPDGDKSTRDAWLASYGGSIAQIVACLAAKEPAADCNAVRAGTIPPPK